MHHLIKIEQTTGEFISSILMIFLISSCSSNETYELGLNFVEPSSRLIVCDTFSVELSTILEDSIKTSGSETILCGTFSDSICGFITCSGFFQISIPSGVLVSDQEVYDSTVMQLKLNGYYFGDTSRYMQINVHRLTEDIEPGENNNYLYNTRSLTYETDPLGELRFLPRPAHSDTVTMRLNNNFGQELLGILKDKDEVKTSAEGFLDWFKGLALIPSGNNNCILGIEANSNNLWFRIYTHNKNDYEDTKYYEFKLANSAKQFNHISNSRVNSIFHNLSNKIYAVPSKETGNKTLLTGGTGIYTKIRFPSLNQYFLLENTILLKAELYLRPANRLYNQSKMPDTLLLGEVNKYNDQSILLRSDNSYFSGYFHNDELYGENTYYYFDVSEYLQNVLYGGYYNADKCLFVRLPEEKEKKTVDRILFETGSLKPTIRMYFAKYLN